MSHSGENILNQAQMCVFSCCCGCMNVSFPFTTTGTVVSIYYPAILYC